MARATARFAQPLHRHSREPNPHDIGVLADCWESAPHRIRSARCGRRMTVVQRRVNPHSKRPRTSTPPPFHTRQRFKPRGEPSVP
ncbi:hypothetical protein Bmul_5836 [Burkholderia multivorans ATCC 17616]|nr:hypothetical protein Bmul_5836 [Burkholderia multivorans ATCC 17616]